MPFNWRDFLDHRRIAYETEGSQFRVSCPWCHSNNSMSISAAGKGWKCWRRPTEHSGRNPTKLVQALLQCSWSEACNITGRTTADMPEDVLSKVTSLLAPKTKITNPPLALPPEFQSFRGELPSSLLFRDYLKRRGFTHGEIADLTDDYGIRYCMRGRFHGRIIFPIVFENALVTWTARTIFPSEELRYKTLSADPERAKNEGLQPAVGPVTEYLWGYDDLLQLPMDSFHTLVLCEGPFDALKVDVLGRPHGIAATCFFTMTASPTQILLLHDLLPVFRHKILLLDQNTTAASLHLTWQLESLGVVRRELPRRFKDPGELQSYKDLSCVLNLDVLESRQHV